MVSKSLIHMYTVSEVRLFPYREIAGRVSNKVMDSSRSADLKLFSCSGFYNQFDILDTEVTKSLSLST